MEESGRNLLPISNKNSLFIPPNSRQILRIAINLKELIDTVIPIEYDQTLITCNKSRILNTQVIALAREACGGNPDDPKSVAKYQAVLIFCLLKVRSWYFDLSSANMHDYDLYLLRATSCQQLCKYIIEEEEDSGNFENLLINMLCRRYIINELEIDQDPVSALELASDTHATIVIGSSGYQRCLKYLWRGWIVQSRWDPIQYVMCDDAIRNTKFSAHLTPDRLKAPIYQNFLQLLISFIYLVLYTVIVNSKDSVSVAPINFLEMVFYIFTIGFVFDEFDKLYHVGSNYITFWNVFNDAMYSLVLVSMVFRFISVNDFLNNHNPELLDIFSYRILACAAPLMWSRIILFLDSQKFMGTMLIVVKQMMKESLIFFVLLLFIMVGFLQGFLALDSSDGSSDITAPIIGNLILTVVGESSFDMFEKMDAYPYSAILYYSYCFIITVILLNILVALYSSAYQNIVDNATDEYLALVVQKTLRYMRAPDENVYIPPLNLIELMLSPVGWVLKTFFGVKAHGFRKIHNSIMTVLYFPSLIVIAFKEVKEAKRATYNILKNLPPDSNEIDTPWDLEDGYVEEEDDSVFNSNIRLGLRATNAKNNVALQQQKQAEDEDPNFNVNGSWYERVKNSSQPVDKGCESGIGWEAYNIYEYVRDLKKD